jgi:hypothetical protein
MLRRILCVLSVLLASSSSALAAVPFTFSNGQVADANQVNANFGALVSALDALTARVDALESTTTASLAGTYDYFEVKVDVDQNSSSSFSIAGGGASGTVVLNANGTGTISLTSQYRQLTYNEQTLQCGNVANSGSVNVLSTDVAHFDTPETNNDSITWSLSAGVVTIATGDGDANFVVAGRILVEGISSTDGEGQNGVTLMVRR